MQSLYSYAMRNSGWRTCNAGRRGRKDRKSYKGRAILKRWVSSQVLKVGRSVTRSNSYFLSLLKDIFFTTIWFAFASNGNIRTALITHQAAGHMSDIAPTRLLQPSCSMTACRGAALRGTSSDIQHRVHCGAKRRGHACHFRAPQRRTGLDRLHVDHIVEKCFVFFKRDKDS